MIVTVMLIKAKVRIALRVIIRPAESLTLVATTIRDKTIPVELILISSICCLVYKQSVQAQDNNT